MVLFGSVKMLCLKYTEGTGNPGWKSNELVRLRWVQLCWELGAAARKGGLRFGAMPVGVCSWGLHGPVPQPARCRVCGSTMLPFSPGRLEV